jgi:ubiquitin-like 1-activating enzyme E1 A
MQISVEESTLYDRQIRLWGLEVQKRIKDSRLCVLTRKINGLVNELLKNLILAGVGNLSLISDHRFAGEEDLACAFSICASLFEQDLTATMPIGEPVVLLIRNQLQKMNPSVKLEVGTDMSIMQNETYFSSFDLVIMTNFNLTEMVSNRTDRIVDRDPGSS